MGKIYEKWRDLNNDPFEIKFKKIKLKEIISYPPAGNDVVEAKCIINNKLQEMFIKIERSKVADFISELKNLSIIFENKFYDKIPIIYEDGTFNDKKYLVLGKIDGERLSDILNENKNALKYKDTYLNIYGKELAKIHNIPSKKFGIAKQRVINDFPKKDNYSKFDKFIIEYVNYLEKNKPNVECNCFIHGDFHYANILWNNKKIAGIIDFEYSGVGFKEQDIAWAIALRPTQHFLDNLKDIKNFLTGYKSLSSFDNEKLRWCLLNAYCHFYLMNIENQEYKKRLKKLLEIIREYDFNL